MFDKTGYIISNIASDFVWFFFGFDTLEEFKKLRIGKGSPCFGEEGLMRSRQNLGILPCCYYQKTSENAFAAKMQEPYISRDHAH